MILVAMLRLCCSSASLRESSFEQAIPECNANLGPAVRVEGAGSAGVAASNGQAGNSTLKATGCFQLLGEKEGFSLGLRFGYTAPCLRVTALVNCMALTSARSRQSGYGSFHKPLTRTWFVRSNRCSPESRG